MKAICQNKRPFPYVCIIIKQKNKRFLKEVNKNHILEISL